MFSVQRCQRAVLIMLGPRRIGGSEVEGSDAADAPFWGLFNLGGRRVLI